MPFVVCAALQVQTSFPVPSDSLRTSICGDEQPRSGTSQFGRAETPCYAKLRAAGIVSCAPGSIARIPRHADTGLPQRPAALKFPLKRIHEPVRDSAEKPVGATRIADSPTRITDRRLLMAPCLPGI